MILFSLAVILSLSKDGVAATVSLPETGQTQCYNSGGSPIGCPGTGQDGDWNAGVAIAGQRFTPGAGAQAACVTDNLTGLMWVKSPDGTTRTWQQGLNYVTGLNLCGYTDWRVPSIVELESLVNDGYNEQSCSGPPCVTNAAWLNNQALSNVQPGYYWSGTTRAFSTDYAWYINMSDGYLDFDAKSFGYYIWPVRGGGGATASPWQTGQKNCYDATGTSISCTGTGQDGDIRPGVAWPVPRFTINGTTGTVTDNLTGLIWLKNADCFGSLTWANARSAANILASGTCGLSDGSSAGDWRLPNRKELLSLVDFAYFSPALANAEGTGQGTEGDPFGSVQSSVYWSATTYAAGTDYAWDVNIGGGFVHNLSKTSSHSLWPVRGGHIDRLATCPNSLIRIGTNPFTTIEDAYGAAVNNDVIQLQAVYFSPAGGVLTMADNKTVTLQGGNSCNYSNQIDTSTVSADVVIGGAGSGTGAVIMGRVSIE